MAKTWLRAFCVAVYGMSGLTAAFAEVRTQNIDYEHAGAKLQGFLAWDDRSEAKRPGVLVIHEWWGLNDYARQRARMLAELGYTALAVDMYGDGRTAEHPEDAGKFASAVGGNMPVFGDKLSPQEIDANLAWVQSHWSDRIYALWHERDVAVREGMQAKR